jgi:hypothetical protein
MKKKGLFVGVIVVGALALPSAAFGQATRTWVSGVGDDANPCSRTAPCKTFAGAISKTADGGIINALDDAGYGTLTITKSITIDGGSHIAGVLSSGGINGFNINDASSPHGPGSAKVVLRNLDIEGNTSIPSSGGFTPGLNGVRITSAKSVKIYDSEIHDFSRNGVTFETSTSLTKGLIERTDIYDVGGNGVMLAPTAASATVRATIRRTNVDDAACGVTASSFPTTNVYTSNCGVATSGAAGTAIIVDLNNSFTNATAAGIFSNGPNAFNRIGGNNVLFNGFGLVTGGGGGILSFGDNYVAGNGTDGAPTSTIPRS